MKIKNIASPFAPHSFLPTLRVTKKVKIGMAIDDLRLERWQKDRDIFVKKAESFGAKSICAICKWQ